MTTRPMLDAATLPALLARYDGLGQLVEIARNGLSENLPSGLVTTTSGTFFVKAYDADNENVAAEHRLIRHLSAHAFATPKLHVNLDGATLTPHDELFYAVFDQARGLDRYSGAPAAGPFETLAEAESVGAMLASFHLATEDFVASPRPLDDLVARVSLFTAPTLAEGEAALAAEAPLLGAWLAEREDWRAMAPRIEAIRAGIATGPGALREGVIHGDFLKTNLLWDGTEVASVLDFGQWNVAPVALDLAIALLAVGFDWPPLLDGGSDLNSETMRAMLKGYDRVRPRPEAERAALPWLMAVGRFEFYLGAVHRALALGLAHQAEVFWALSNAVLGWFAAHPDWAEAL